MLDVRCYIRQRANERGHREAVGSDDLVAKRSTVLMCRTEIDGSITGILGEEERQNEDYRRHNEVKFSTTN